MRTKPFLFLLSIFFSCPFFSFSQKQFLDASITLNSGEVRHGQLLLKTWLTTPRTIQFRTREGDLIRYGISEISAFEVTRTDGQVTYFIRRLVEIEISPDRIDMNKIDRSQELNFRSDTVWLELMYRGAWDLFFLRDKDDKVHYLIAKGGDNPVDLVNKSWAKRGYKFEKVELFRKQLLDLSSDCPQLFSFITEMEFNQKNLVEICRRYDDCTGIEPAYQQKRMRGHFSGQILAGVHFSKVQFYPFLNREIKKIPGGQIGFGLAYYPGRANQRISIYNEVMVYNDEKTDSIKLRSYDLISSALSYKATQIGISNLVSFEVFNSRFRPTLKIGLFNRISLSQQISRIDPPNGSTIDLNYAKGKHEMGPEVALSVGYQRFGLDFRYFRSSLLNGYLVKDASSKFWGVSLTYKVF